MPSFSIPTYFSDSFYLLLCIPLLLICYLFILPASVKPTYFYPCNTYKSKKSPFISSIKPFFICRLIFIITNSLAFVYFCVTGFDLTLTDIFRVLTSAGFRSRPTAKPRLKNSLQKCSSAFLYDYHVWGTIVTKLNSESCRSTMRRAEQRKYLQKKSGRAVATTWSEDHIILQKPFCQLLTSGCAPGVKAETWSAESLALWLNGFMTLTLVLTNIFKQPRFYHTDLFFKKS